MTAPKSKKPKIDLSELATKVWEHYRNYLDSLEESNDQGDIDELQELIELLQEHVKPASASASTSTSVADWKTVVDLLPVLLSVSYYHLVDVAISQYLVSAKEEQDEQAQEIQRLLAKSLEFYPSNAATWSMGANFGRMSSRLSLPAIREWYEQAVESATPLRKKAVEILEDEDNLIVEDAMVKEWVELLVVNQVVGVQFEGDDDEEEEEGEEKEEKEEGEEEDIEEEESEGQFSSSAVEATSRFMCAMLWSMDGQHDRALQHLKKFPLTLRLHPNVWTVSKSLPDKAPTKAPLVFRPKEGILPEALYKNMLDLFAPDAVYWDESSYSNRGYYSYFMDYDKEQKKTRNLLEDVITNYLLPRAQQVLDEDEENAGDSICGFEWWAHTRPIQANLGHNLHFDTDESMLAQEGKVTHPILSAVLYLTGGGVEQPAGTTIILDQTPDSTSVAEHCWQGTPQDNSVLLFPGNLLHGVLPCPGQKEETTNGGIHSREELMKSWKEPPKQSSEGNRLTFMVGFWTRNVPKTMKKRSIYGPCGPLPPATEEHTWVAQMNKGYGHNESKTVSGGQRMIKSMPAMPLPQASPAWESITADKVEEDEPPLSIPYAIDHRFFVHGAPECFRKSLFEDREGEC